jgi:hypothetical protein
VGVLLRELRAVAGEGSRLAVSFSITGESAGGGARRARFESAVRALGEPVRNALTAAAASGLLGAAGWRVAQQPERARHAGLVLAVPA